MPASPRSVAVTPAVTARSYLLRHDARPPVANTFRRLHFHDQKRVTAEWRRAFGVLALGAKVPPLAAVTITVTHELANRRSLPDTGACMPAVKAAVDGLVDAGVLGGDGPDVVRSLLFLAPVVTGRDALVLEVCEAP